MNFCWNSIEHYATLWELVRPVYLKLFILDRRRRWWTWEDYFHSLVHIASQGKFLSEFWCGVSNDCTSHGQSVVTVLLELQLTLVKKLLLYNGFNHGQTELPVAWVTLHTHIQYWATANPKADVIKTKPRVSLTRKRYDSTLGPFRVLFTFIFL